jgi:hypothetical protein
MRTKYLHWWRIYRLMHGTDNQDVALHLAEWIVSAWMQDMIAVQAAEASIKARDNFETFNSTFTELPL